MKRLLMLILPVVLLFSGCKFPESEQEKAAREEREFLKGEYVYLDYLNVLHFKTNCFFLHGTIVDGEYKPINVGVHRILKTEVKDSMLLKCCPDCVTDERYKTLIR